MPENPEIPELVRDLKEQVLYLQELGVSEWNILAADTVPDRQVSSSPAKPEKFVPVEAPVARLKPAVPAQTAGRSRLTNIPSLPKKASEMREILETSVASVPNVTMKQTEAVEVLFEVAPTLSETADTIESIRAEIGNCTRCDLCNQGRKQIVHTTGNFNAELMFVGEAPGADEDEQGFPFVGRAGQLLTKIIEGIGLKREEVCIGNINRCRPPGNRQPVPAETAACRPFLLREVAVVRPKVIVVLGNTATQNLLDIKTPISKLRGNFQDYFGVKVMPTFHPAYLLRDPHKKREVWEDMKKVRDYLNSL
jgi:DNA polymerase